jgi:hypothetical protein
MFFEKLCEICPQEQIAKSYDVKMEFPMRDLMMRCWLRVVSNTFRSRASFFHSGKVFGVIGERLGVDFGPPGGHLGVTLVSEKHSEASGGRFWRSREQVWSHLGVRNQRNFEVRFRSRFFSFLF